MTPTSLTIARTLTAVGIKRSDFSVKKLIERGEVTCTYVVLYTREAHETALRFAQEIEESTRARGWGFTVTARKGRDGMRATIRN